VKGLPKDLASNAAHPKPKEGRRLPQPMKLTFIESLHTGQELLLDPWWRAA
jgi:hypothetical protein